MQIHAIRVKRSESGSGKWGWVGSVQEDWLDVYVTGFDFVPTSKNVFEATFDQAANTWTIQVDGGKVPVEIYVPKECCVISEQRFPQETQQAH